MSQEEKISHVNSIELAHCILEAIAEKKGEDIMVMDIRELAVFADYFVICSGTSERQLKALVEGVDEAVRQKFRAHARRTEGDALSGWILMDYTDVIVHIFAPHQRDFYQLEELWKEAPVVLKMQ